HRPGPCGGAGKGLRRRRQHFLRRAAPPQRHRPPRTGGPAVNATVSREVPMVYRVYVEKKAGFDHEAQSLLAEVRGLLGIESVTGLRLLNRYDVEGISRELFASCVPTVFSEPP